MSKGRKDKTVILQNIRLRRSLKQNRRNKKLHTECGVLPVKILRAPRKMLRTSMGIKIAKQDNNVAYINSHKKRLIKEYLPTNLKYLINCKDGPFYLNDISRESFKSNGVVEIPENFSILECPEESYDILRRLISALLLEKVDKVFLDYKKCIRVDLGAQVLLDIILKDYWKFQNICKRFTRNQKDYFPTTLGGINIEDDNVQKILFSVGSPAILQGKDGNFNDVEKYKLCIHDNDAEKDVIRKIEQKELDTSELVEYVIKCLKRMKKKLTREKLDDLCTVIGEALINADEHSTTKYRFSIGYFKEELSNGNHFGIFQLVILNFGQTIYEKFKDENCPNKTVAGKMRDLSKKYTTGSLFTKRKFEEETLWTLYAMQEGITSVSSDQYKMRGNGFIRFIESFFNIKANSQLDDISKMCVISGRAKITFDGMYGIKTVKKDNGDFFKVMTFNNSGNIEELPDNNYVSCTENYFPGTLISAKILLNEDDIKQI